MKLSFWRASVMGAVAATSLLAGVGFTGPASAYGETSSSTVISHGHGTKSDHYLVNLQHVTIHREHTRGYGGWALSEDPDVPIGGKFFVYNADTGEVPKVIDPSRESKQSLKEVSDWKDVAFSYFKDHVEVRYGNYKDPNASYLIIASASRFGSLADITNEKFTGQGMTKEDAKAAAKSEMAKFELDHFQKCTSGGSLTSQDDEMAPGSWTVVLSAECTKSVHG